LPDLAQTIIDEFEEAALFVSAVYFSQWTNEFSLRFQRLKTTSNPECLYHVKFTRPKYSAKVKQIIMVM
jgi:hypothetical protein